MTSQFILGLNQLISPFKWCFSSIPILPNALVAMVDAPIPLMVGITPLEFDILMEDDMSETYNKIWIHLKLQEMENDQFRPFEIDNLIENLEF